MAAGDDDERIREIRKLDEDNRARIARLKNTSGATLATRPNQVVNTPLGPRTPGPVPSNLPARISPDGIDRAAYLYQDRQRFRDGSGPTKILVSHDPYQEHPPRNDGRSQCSFHLSTDEGIHEIPVGSTVSVRLGKVVIEFLTTEPAVVRPGADAIVGGLARHPGACGNIDIHCRTGLTGFPKVTVDNPFPGMSGADLAPDGSLILRRPVRPKMDALFVDPFAFPEGKRADGFPDAESVTGGPRDLVRANLERLRQVVQPGDMQMIRKWTTDANDWRSGVSVQSFVANLTKAGLVLCLGRSGGDVLLGMGFTDGVMTECKYDHEELPTKKLLLPR